MVRFEPVGKEDVAAAEQETDYVNHVFMQKNPGFLVLYGFIKDALLCKVGIVKVWWEEKEQDERETYLDQPDETFAMLVADPGIEVVEHTEHRLRRRTAGEPAGRGPEGEGEPPRQLHDVTVVTGAAMLRAGRGRAARGVRDRPQRPLDPRRRLLLPRGLAVGERADRAGLRSRAGQGAAELRRAGQRGSAARDTVNENSGAKAAATTGSTAPTA